MMRKIKETMQTKIIINREKNPYDRNENSVMDSDIKTSHLFLLRMEKLFIIRDIYEGTYGSLITRNNMLSDGFEHKTE